MNQLLRYLDRVYKNLLDLGPEALARLTLTGKLNEKGAEQIQSLLQALTALDAIDIRMIAVALGYASANAGDLTDLHDEDGFVDWNLCRAPTAEEWEALQEKIRTLYRIMEIKDTKDLVEHL